MDGPYFMDAVITPHRSLSKRGFIVLICVLTGVNVVTAVMLVAVKAAPAALFLVLDVAALAVAFLVSRKAARRLERVQVTAAEVRVLRVTPAGSETIWLSPTAFTRLSMGDADGDEPDLQLRVSDRGLAVARALSRRERLDFAAALDRALRRARAAPRYP